MSEMVERHARALCVATGDDDPDVMVWPYFRERRTGSGHVIVPWMGRPVPLWKMRVNEARAAIAAMREPTEPMETAGIMALDEAAGENDVRREDLVRAFQAMIDEALKD